MISLTIAHNIFLTRDQRYSLSEPNTELLIQGISIPVWIEQEETNEPAEEVVCNYKITNNGASEFIKILDDGYELNLNIKDCKSLLDIVDIGGECLMVTSQSKMHYNSRSFYAVHFVSINDIKVLENSILEKV